MPRFVCLVGVLVLFVSGNALAEAYYSVSLPAIPNGPVPTAAFSFRFQSANLLVPTPLGIGFDVMREPGFAFDGTPIDGFSLESISFVYCIPEDFNGAPNGVPPFPCMFVYFVNSANGYTLILGVAMPSVPTRDGTYVLNVTPNLYEGPVSTTFAIVGYQGPASASVTPFFLPFGYEYCAAVADGRLNSTLGRVYDPFTESCVGGVVTPLVPPPGDLVCAPGFNGPGGIYDPYYSDCYLGAIGPPGYFYCAAGAYGPGGFYQPTAGCDHGVVVPAGDAYCPRGLNGPGGLYSLAAEYAEHCDRGKIGSYNTGP
jgi:hypothetical protein